jgi:chorismate mutase
MMPPAMRLFALRGATSIERDEARLILDGTTGLLQEILESNSLTPDDVVSCVFTCTPDLTAAFPAEAARRVGLSAVPLLCAQEIDVAGSLPRVIRLLVHYYGDEANPPQHVYLREATSLRRDLEGAQ